MSSNIRLLTEEESAKIAEVSVDTIRKYRDCGLLDPIVKDNNTFFQELDIRTLFYAKFKERESAPSTAIPSPPPESRAAAPESPTMERIEPVTGPASAPVSAPVSEPVSEPVSASASESAASVQPEVVDMPVAAADAALPQAGELVEINKSLREQIQILREERDWLRERIEKLEARSEREQMLLLSQSENVRKLITTAKKPFWQRALPWLGN